MKKIIFFFYINVLCINAFGQSIKKDTVFKETNSLIISYNNNIYTFIDERNKYKLLKDTSIILKNINKFNINFYYYNQEQEKLFLSTNKGTKNYLYSLDFTNDEFKAIKDYGHASLKYGEENQLYYLINNEIQIENISTGETSEKQNLDDLLSDEWMFPFELVIFPQNNKLLLGGGVPDDGAIIGIDYYFLDKKSLKLEQTNNSNIDISYLKKYDKETPIFLKFYSFDHNYAFLDTLILNHDFTLFSPFLDIHLSVSGLIIEHDSIKSLLVRSEIDNDNKDFKGHVIINYSANPLLEKTFYRLSRNYTESKNYLNSFNRFDLHLLKNMIYAKHNFAFKDDFLNAYFNLYSFYRYQSENRLENVDHLLTDADKKNLKTIESVLQKKK